MGCFGWVFCMWPGNAVSFKAKVPTSRIHITMHVIFFLLDFADKMQYFQMEKIPV